MKTSGHLASNGGIRGHSAGDVFPFIVLAVGTYDNLLWRIKKPSGGLMVSRFMSASRAHEVALYAKKRYEEGYNV